MGIVLPICIEGGRETAGKTRVLDNPSEVAKQIIYIAETSSGLSVVSVIGGLQLIYNNFLDPYKNILDKYKIGEGNGIKGLLI
jgi:hypothetical protein